jgi:hypothetical protein
MKNLVFNTKHVQPTICNKNTIFSNINKEPLISPTRLLSQAKPNFAKFNSFNTISCAYFNARSINNKLHYLHNLLENCNLDIILITETWLNKNTPDSLLLNGKNFKIYRNDRNSKGGGSLILVRNNIHSLQTHLNIPIDLLNTEITCVDVFASSIEQKIRFACIYHPPCAAISILKTKALCKLIYKITSTCDSTCIIAGDFNLPLINWSIPISFGDSSHDLFVETCSANALTQLVSGNTRLNNLLDLILTNNSKNVFNIETIAPFTSTCDHCMIIFNCNLEKYKPYKKTIKYNFFKADYNSIISDLQNVNWYLLAKQNQDVETFWQTICNFLNLSISSHVPLTFNKKNNIQPLAIRKLASKKRTLYRDYKRTGNTSALVKFKICSRLYDAEVHKNCISREKDLVVKSNIAKFYSFVNKKSKCYNSVAPLLQTDGSLITDDCEKSQLLNNFFGSVFVTDNGIAPVIDLPKHTNSLSNIIFSYNSVVSHLQKLPPKSSKSPDGYPAIFLKSIANVIAIPFSILFEMSMSKNVIPRIWKTAIICPIFKKGNPSLSTNYRPISMTCIVCKIMESIITESVTSYLLLNNFISVHQYGFLKRRSTCTQMLTTLNEWTTAVNNKKIVDIIYIDFEKAFDTVSHSKLLFKLRCYGIKYELLNWVTNFLTNRSQRVCINDSYSNSIHVKSGIPQGTVLGPILFLIFINDITSCIEGDCGIKLFADDSKLYQARKDGNNINLVNTLKRISEWSNNCQLNISTKKCFHLRYGKILLPEHSYLLDIDTPIESIDSIQDIGIFISSDMKFSKHCSHIASKASSCAYLLLKSFISNDSQLLIRAYKVYIRPILESCTPVWNPYLLKDIRRVEKVQKNYTRIICKRCCIPYKDYASRLDIFNLDSLECRRIKFDLLMTYKIMHNLVDLPSSEFFTLAPTHYSTRCHSQKLSSRNNYINDIRRFFFSERVTKIWNSLPDYVVYSSSLSIFKSNLKTCNIQRHCLLF